MERYSPLMLMFLLGCGKASDSGLTSLPLTIENLIGHWRVVSTEVSAQTRTLKGSAFIEYKSDGSYVAANQGFYFDEDVSAACWSASKGTFSTSGSVVTEVMDDEIGSEDCISRDYNPHTSDVMLTASTITASLSGSKVFLERSDALPTFSFDSFKEKFEKVDLVIGDPDRPSDFKMPYRSPKLGGWRHVCPRLAGQEREGFTISTTFSYNSSIYETFVQWDEGDIKPENYNSSAPGFRFHKRAATDSDSFGTMGSGRYYCSNTGDCVSKCNLKVDNYSLIDSSADLELTCAGASADSPTDSDNLFGTTLTDFSLKAHCNYKPDLGL